MLTGLRTATMVGGLALLVALGASGFAGCGSPEWKPKATADNECERAMREFGTTSPEPYDACGTWQEFAAAAAAFDVAGVTRDEAQIDCEDFASSGDHVPALCETEFGTTTDSFSDSVDTSTIDPSMDSGSASESGSGSDYTTGAALEEYINNNVQARDSTSIRASCPNERLTSGDTLECQVVFSDGSYKTVTVTVDSIDASGQVSATLGIAP